MRHSFHVNKQDAFRRLGMLIGQPLLDDIDHGLCRDPDHGRVGIVATARAAHQLNRSSSARNRARASWGYGKSRAMQLGHIGAGSTRQPFQA
jgi:hypothetical protein